MPLQPTRNHLDIYEGGKHKSVFKGIIQSFKLPTLPEHVEHSTNPLQTILHEVRTSKKQFFKASTLELMRALLMGQWKPNGNILIPELTTTGFNMILEGFCVDLFANFDEVASADQTLAMKYFAVGTDFTDNVTAQDQLNREIYRAVPAARYNDGHYKWYASTLLLANQGNPTTTTVTSGTSGTQFAVASATGLAIGVQIYVNLAGSPTLNRTTTITNVSGLNITCSPALDATPTGGEEVIPYHSEAGMATGETATGSADTGVFANRKTFANLKIDPDTMNGLNMLYNVILDFTP